ncbi:hypothetical protein NKL07_00520 [Mesorhizobium sp. C280B]|uniref:hypothetical protein n=1 Tax=unclassified Mesorhizobium TaxID=325217 RepID=UPI00333C4080
MRATSTHTRQVPAARGLLLSRVMPTTRPSADEKTMTTAEMKTVLASPVAIAQ